MNNEKFKKISNENLKMNNLFKYSTLFFVFHFLIFIFFISPLLAQQNDYSIEYETHKVGVFNPEWETFHTLNANKYEHITGYFREDLARTILDAVSQKRVKIYDNRKREISLDTVIQRIIRFERDNFSHIVSKDTVLRYIVPFISAYDFEEAVTYHFDNLKISKQVISYAPYLVKYRSFSEDKVDTVQMPLFYIFPKNENLLLDNDKLDKNPVNSSKNIISIPDTVISVLKLKYPVKEPMTQSLFSHISAKDRSILNSDGTNFSSPKDIDKLFVITKSADYYDEETGKDSTITTYSDILPEDIIALRIAETWQIDMQNLMIIKQVHYFLPLYNYDDERFTQLGIRVKISNE